VAHAPHPTTGKRITLAVVGRDLPGPPLARPRRRAGAIKPPHLLELSGIGNSGEPAQAQPALQVLSKLSRAIELDAARSNGALHCKIAHPHARHGLQVGRNVKADLESRIGGTKIGLLAVADQPPGAF